jgi:hypothetical protein
LDRSTGLLCGVHQAARSRSALAHDIHKEIIEIKSGFSTGATTPVAEA